MELSKKILIGIIALMLGAWLPVHADEAAPGVIFLNLLDNESFQCAGTVWTSNLFQGESSGDVLELQRILNIDPATQIAASGPGSPNNETDYFGPLTKAAVERFQEKYASDILFPQDLFQPTGYVGPATRLELGKLCM